MARVTKKVEGVEKQDTSVERGRLKKLEAVKILAIVFLLEWILIGLFFLAFIVQGTRRGMFDYVLFNKTPQTQEDPTTAAPTETTLPKIGTINIACAEEALKPESIQKLVADYDIGVLTSEEKTEFEKCIVAPAPVESPTS